MAGGCVSAGARCAAVPEHDSVARVTTVAHQKGKAVECRKVDKVSIMLELFGVIDFKLT